MANVGCQPTLTVPASTVPTRSLLRLATSLFDPLTVALPRFSLAAPCWLPNHVHSFMDLQECSQKSQTQVLPPVVSLSGTHLARVKPQVTRWRGKTKPFFSGAHTLPQGGGACLPFWKFWVPSAETPSPPPRWG